MRPMASRLGKWISCLVLLAFVAPSWGQEGSRGEPSKGRSPEGDRAKEIEKVREEVKKLTTIVREAMQNLMKAQARLSELEGKGTAARMPGGGFGRRGFGRDGWRPGIWTLANAEQPRHGGPPRAERGPEPKEAGRQFHRWEGTGGGPPGGDIRWGRHEGFGGRFQDRSEGGRRFGPWMHGEPGRDGRPGGPPWMGRGPGRDGGPDRKGPDGRPGPDGGRRDQRGPGSPPGFERKGPDGGPGRFPGRGDEGRPGGPPGGERKGPPGGERRGPDGGGNYQEIERRLDRLTKEIEEIKRMIKR